MKNSKQNAERWLRDAERTLEQAAKNIEIKAYNVACFLAEQSAQKFLKAVLYFDGARFITIHSINKLIEEVSKIHPEFLPLMAEGSKLDQYYLSARYPDAVAEPAIPSEIFIEDQAKAAVLIAEKIFKASRSVISS